MRLFGLYGLEGANRITFMLTCREARGEKYMAVEINIGAIAENDQPTVSSPTCTALLCCPFCGGVPHKRVIHDVVYAKCINTDCHLGRVRGYLFTKTKWNTRAS